MDIGIGIYVFVLVVCGLVALIFSVGVVVLVTKEQDRLHQLRDRHDEEILRLKRKDERDKDVFLKEFKELLEAKEGEVKLDTLIAGARKKFEDIDPDKIQKSQIDFSEIKTLNGYLDYFKWAFVGFCFVISVTLFFLHDYSKSNYKIAFDKMVEAEVQKKLEDAKKADEKPECKK